MLALFEFTLLSAGFVLSFIYFWRSVSLSRGLLLLLLAEKSFADLQLPLQERDSNAALP